MQTATKGPVKGQSGGSQLNKRRLLTLFLGLSKSDSFIILVKNGASVDGFSGYV